MLTMKPDAKDGASLSVNFQSEEGMAQAIVAEVTVFCDCP